MFLAHGSRAALDLPGRRSSQTLSPLPGETKTGCAVKSSLSWEAIAAGCMLVLSLYCGYLSNSVVTGGARCRSRKRGLTRACSMGSGLTPARSVGDAAAVSCKLTGQWSSLPYNKMFLVTQSHVHWATAAQLDPCFLL